MEGENGVTRSLSDDINSSNIQGVQMVGESGVTRSSIDEIHVLDIQRDQSEG